MVQLPTTPRTPTTPRAPIKSPRTEEKEGHKSPAKSPTRQRNSKLNSLRDEPNGADNVRITDEGLPAPPGIPAAPPVLEVVPPVRRVTIQEPPVRQVRPPAPARPDIHERKIVEIVHVAEPQVQELPPVEVINIPSLLTRLQELRLLLGWPKQDVFPQKVAAALNLVHTGDKTLKRIQAAWTKKEKEVREVQAPEVRQVLDEMEVCFAKLKEGGYVFPRMKSKAAQERASAAKKRKTTDTIERRAESYSSSDSSSDYEGH